MRGATRPGGRRHSGGGSDGSTSWPWLELLRRPPRWLLGTAWLIIAVQLVTATGFLLAGTPGESERRGADPGRAQGRGVSSIFDGTAPGGSSVDSAARTKAVKALLATRAKAILARDRTAFLATVDPAAEPLRARQAAFFDNLAQLPLGTWSYQLDPDRETLLPPGVAEAYGDAAWAPQVRLRYGLDGYDTTPTTQEQRHLFVRVGERWYLADDGLSPRQETSSGTVRNLWDFGPVTVMSSPTVLVAGHPGSEALMRTVLGIAREAVPAVDGVWGTGWDRRVVVLVPASGHELGRLVEETGNLSRMAAFTSADVPHAGPPVGKRVLVNPDVFGTLSPFGQQVVLTHEITHVATRHVTSAETPYWLAEGFADYVAYRATGATARRAARELSKDVQLGKLPERLPQWSDFAVSNPRLSQAYQEAWLACRLIVERTDEETLVRLYHRLSRAGGDPEAALDVALRDELGIGRDQFLATWRRYLKDELTP